jgi:hypothetical protein
MQISVDTGCSMGTLSTQKTITIKEATGYDKLVAAFAEAKAGKDPKKQENARAELMSKAFTRLVKPGQVCSISGSKHTMRGAFPGADKVSAYVKWFPEKTQLRVKFDVTDAFFSTHADPRYPWDASCVAVYVCPTGLPEDVHQMFFVPDGKDGNARLVQETAILKNPEKIKATWKRTARGYTMEIRIPWTCLKNYKADWKMLPVQSLICSKPPDKYRVAVIMNGLGFPIEKAETYVGLVRR